MKTLINSPAVHATQWLRKSVKPHVLLNINSMLRKVLDIHITIVSFLKRTSCTIFLTINYFITLILFNVASWKISQIFGESSQNTWIIGQLDKQINTWWKNLTSANCDLKMARSSPSLLCWLKVFSKSNCLLQWQIPILPNIKYYPSK